MSGNKYIYVGICERVLYAINSVFIFIAYKNSLLQIDLLMLRSWFRCDIIRDLQSDG